MYSYLLIQYKSMAQEVLFCMQGCFYLSALSKWFTFYLGQILQSIYFILFFWTFQRRLSSQKGVVVCLFYFICQQFPTIYFNFCTKQDLSYNCQVGSMLLFRPTSFFQQFTLTPCILQDLGRNCVRTESLRRQNKTRMVSNTFLLYTSWCIYLAIHILSIKKD